MDKPENTEFSKEEKFRQKQFQTSSFEIIAIDQDFYYADLCTRLHDYPLISKPTPPPDTGLLF